MFKALWSISKTLAAYLTLWIALLDWYFMAVLIAFTSLATGCLNTCQINEIDETLQA